MYSTCLSCHASLGANEVIERFPLGRRLAFDAAKGRLWVVCRKCGRWNLTPLEERWEAIEDCERLFRGTRLRVSTDNVGLAKVAEGLELVRIGRTEGVELAAWRYGDVIRKRRRRKQIVSGLLYASYVAGGPVALAIGALVVRLPDIAQGRVFGHGLIGRVTDDAGEVHQIRARHARWAQLRSVGGDWGMLVRTSQGTVELTGDRALHAARIVLPHLNEAGAKLTVVRAAVGELREAGDVGRYFARVAERAEENERIDRSFRFAPFGLRWSSAADVKTSLRMQRPEVRLALEMAAHDEQERRALEGELAALEAAWKEAEEIAAIADEMFLPPNVGDFIRKHRRPS